MVKDSIHAETMVSTETLTTEFMLLIAELFYLPQGKSNSKILLSFPFPFSRSFDFLDNLIWSWGFEFQLHLDNPKISFSAWISLLGCQTPVLIIPIGFLTEISNVHTQNQTLDFFSQTCFFSRFPYLIKWQLCLLNCSSQKCYNNFWLSLSFIPENNTSNWQPSHLHCYSIGLSYDCVAKVLG